MELQFLDRVLSCSDCRSDFIFTAGEQLFFHEKQFKNDPKRCKNCKARRSGLSSATTGADGAKAVSVRPETRTHCSDCGVETTVPFKPTQGRPVLCRQCYQKKLRAPLASPIAGSVALGGLAGRGVQQATPVPAELLPAPVVQQTVTTQEAAVALLALPADSQGAAVSPEAALMAAVSISSAQPRSSVATLEDLESISSVALAHYPVTSIPYELLSGQPTEDHAGLLAAMVETADA